MSDRRLKLEICKISNSQLFVVTSRFSSTKLVRKHVCETAKSWKTSKTVFFCSFWRVNTEISSVCKEIGGLPFLKLHGCFVKGMTVECNDKTVQDSQKRFVCWQKQLGTASERLYYQRSCFLSPNCWYSTFCISQLLNGHLTNNIFF